MKRYQESPMRVESSTMSDPSCVLHVTMFSHIMKRELTQNIRKRDYGRNFLPFLPPSPFSQHTSALPSPMVISWSKVLHAVTVPSKN
ncbi:hypothetical protein CDAR_240511 [Caerostris darwini]|uniref:Uncharacterized protein n=1 Tax=Caerostris darwini TaxID=1538125 RepID=A0AAV4PN00_9ARAC|nr:hypothetical protein CDAR_240511 [Caerostris darwini]